jgi:RimJ/RimL family protein N-acetyltransferase
MRLITKRLILRRVEVKDVKSIIENINNLNVSKWLLVVPYPYKMKDAKWWINHVKKEKKDKKSYNFGIELKAEKKIIGGISLDKVDKRQGTASTGYWLGENYWKKGYGSEALKAVFNFAFNKLKLRRIEAEVFEGNPSSGKLLEKYGFKKEGVKRENNVCKADKKVKNAICYGLLKREYKR